MDGVHGAHRVGYDQAGWALRRKPLRAQTDSRIEPVGVGERQWQEDTASLLVEMARREGAGDSASHGNVNVP